MITLIAFQEDAEVKSGICEEISAFERTIFITKYKREPGQNDHLTRHEENTTYPLGGVRRVIGLVSNGARYGEVEIIDSPDFISAELKIQYE